MKNAFKENCIEDFFFLALECKRRKISTGSFLDKTICLDIKKQRWRKGNADSQNISEMKQEEM